MSTRNSQACHAPILLLADVKAAVDAFDRGDVNAHDTADSIVVAVDAYRAATTLRRDAA